jgi:hypothetical protein
MATYESKKGKSNKISEEVKPSETTESNVPVVQEQKP